MAVNGYAAAQDVADLKTSTSALAVAMGERVGANEASIAAAQAGVDAVPAQLDALSNTIGPIAEEVLALRTIAGGGLATGGGALSENRTITVTEASQEQAEAGTSGTVVVTPRRWLDAFLSRSTSFGRSLLASASAAATLTLLGVSSIGSQLFSASSALVARRALDVQETGTLSLLNILTDEERLDVINYTNAIDLTTKIKNWIAGAPVGAVLDMTALKGTVVFTSDIFEGSFFAPVTIRTGTVTIKMDFNGRSFKLPSGVSWEVLGVTRIEPTVPITSIGGNNSPAAALVETAFRTGSVVGTFPAGTLQVSGPGFVAVPGLRPGALIAFFGAEVDPYISHATSSDVSSSATSIPLSGDVSATINGTYGYFLIGGTEVVRGLVTGGAIDLTYDVGGRAKQGTTAVAHLAGTTVVPLVSFVTRVSAVYSSAVDLEEPLPRAVAGSPFVVGAIDVKISGRLLINGGYDQSTVAANVWNGFGVTLGRFVQVDGGLQVRNCPTGGILMMGAQDCTINAQRVSFCGQNGTHNGGAFWQFGSCYGNTVYIETVSDCEAVCYIDNKSSGHVFFGLTKPNLNNSFELGVGVRCYYGMDITGSSYNSVRAKVLDCSAAVLGVFNGTPQQTSPVPSVGNSLIVDTAPDSEEIEGNAQTGNFFLVNGEVPDREAALSLVLGSIQYVPAHSTLDVAFGPYAAKIGDVLQVVNPVLPSGVNVYATCVSDNAVTLNFVNAYTGTRGIAPQTFTIRRTRP